jgi:N-acetylneuraminic acid mutarotase
LPGKIISGFGTARRKPAAVIFLGVALCLALGLALPPAAQAAGSGEYEPTWLSTGSLGTARSSHTATLLPNGKVLVAFGYNSGALASAELYDPATGAWTATGSLHNPRYNHTATLLQNGRVLVVGGDNVWNSYATAELYDPDTGQWTDITGTEPGSHPYLRRAEHTATLLPNGQVLVAGGFDGWGDPHYHFTAELYDPIAGTWSYTVGNLQGRCQHRATLLTNGKVLLTGGTDGEATLFSAELYDPATRTFASNPPSPQLYARSLHSATLLPSGQVLLAAGESPSHNATAELSNSDGTWTATTPLPVVIWSNHTATLLPNGQVLVAGGWSGSASQAGCELFDYAVGSLAFTGTATERAYHTSTLLPNGKVLVAGGAFGMFYDSAELFNPDDGTWSPTGFLELGRHHHTATLLPAGKTFGKVLVVGGGMVPDSAELYDPGSFIWVFTGSLGQARQGGHTATLLANGKVLVVGGEGSDGVPLASAEIYDPETETWSSTGNSLNTSRAHHTATLLPNGKVLVTGGYSWLLEAPEYLSSSELYNPATGTWSATGDPDHPGELNTPRGFHTATLLPNGKVLVVGGTLGMDGGELAVTELYDPATGAWSTDPTWDLTNPRESHTATLLPSGKVLVTGGWGSGIVYNSAELYDPATGTWTETANLCQARIYHTATLLPNGQIIVAGGSNGASPVSSSELFDPGLGFSGAWRPYIAPFEEFPPLLSPGGHLYFEGAGLRGKSEASGGGTNNSSTGYPLVQVRRLDSERIFWLPPSSGSFSDTAFTSANFQEVQDGWCLITVFTNGIPSISQFGRFAGGSPTAVELASFTAAGDKKRVVLAWETYTEKDNTGFHLWRAEAGQSAYTRLTKNLIPAKGSATMGAAYSYADYAVVRGRDYLYKLEDVDTKGASTFHGPVSAAAGAGGSGKGKNK